MFAFIGRLMGAQPIPVDEVRSGIAGDVEVADIHRSYIVEEVRSQGGVDLEVRQLRLNNDFDIGDVVPVDGNPQPWIPTAPPTRTDKDVVPVLPLEPVVQLLQLSSHLHGAGLVEALRVNEDHIPPGTLEDGFTLARAAFNTAAKYQVPVFLLTDQFFVDSTYNTPKPDLDWANEKHIEKTDETYQRYKLTKSGISPRGVPGYGAGLVVADSDEHDEDGHITEDLSLRTKMVNKRLYKKLGLLRKNAIAPRLVGSRKYDTLVISWGSNYYAVKEGIENSDNTGVAMLHFSQVYPLSGLAAKYLEKAEKVLAVENNATGQFANLVEKETRVTIPYENRLLSYNGLPFPVEEITEFINGFSAKGVSQ